MKTSDGCREEEQQRKRADFFAVIDFKKFRAVRLKKMEDAEGDYEFCLCIPLTKNIITPFGAGRWRMYLAARQSRDEQGATHLLFPVADKSTMAQFVNSQNNFRYKRFAPLAGYIAADLSLIEYPPEFTKNTEGIVRIESNAPAGNATRSLADESKTIMQDMKDNILTDILRRTEGRQGKTKTDETDI